MSKKLTGFEPLAALLRVSPLRSIMPRAVPPLQRYRIAGRFGGGVPRGQPRPVPRQLRAPPPRKPPTISRVPPKPRPMPTSYAPPPVVMNLVRDTPVIGDVVSGLSTLGSLLGIGPSLSNVACAPGNSNYPACACPGGLLDASGTKCQPLPGVTMAPGSAGGASRGSGPPLSMR